MLSNLYPLYFNDVNIVLVRCLEMFRREIFFPCGKLQNKALSPTAFRVVV